MRAPIESSSAPWTVALVPVARFDSPTDDVSLSQLAGAIVPATFDARQRDELPFAVTPDPDPIARVRRSDEVALVPWQDVDTSVKTLSLDGRFYWRTGDRADWPLHVSTSIRLAVPATWELIAAGELIFGRGVQERIERRFGGDARSALVDVRDELRAADLAIATLEAPLSGNANAWCDTCMRFVGNERYAAALADAGIDAVSLAANHIGDAGPSGVLDTIRALASVQVAHVGAGPNADAARAARYLSVGAKNVALIAYNDVPPASYAATATRAGSNPLRHDDPSYAILRADVAAARARADVVVVLAHWGIEYEDAPRAHVVAAAHAMVEAGATIVIGDHPHWVQSVERYEGAYIAYGVGNFVFDQMWSEETREGTLQELWFSGDRLVSVRIRPTLIEDYYRPRLLQPDEPAYRRVLERIWSHSSL